MAAVKDFADAWASIYSHSAVLRSGVSFVHIAGLVLGGGCAIAADRHTLIATRGTDEDRRRQVQSIEGAHRVVVAGLALVMVSGFMLFFADLDTYLTQSMFWIKMACVAALMLNGAWLARCSGQVRFGQLSAWTSLRRASILSLVMWFSTTLLGAALPNVL